MPSDTSRHSCRTIHDHRGSICRSDCREPSVDALIMVMSNIDQYMKPEEFLE
jgi:hypothetical protein